MIISLPALLAVTSLIGSGTGQGSLVTTNRPLDLALSGRGYFVLAADKGPMFSRNGAFNLDSAGRIVHAATGSVVLGWTAKAAENGETPSNLSPLVCKIGSVAAGHATSVVTFSGNLTCVNADDEVNEARVRVYDPLGEAHDIVMLFRDWHTHSGPDLGPRSSWAWTAYSINEDGQIGSTPCGSSDTIGNDRIYSDAMGNSVDTLHGQKNWISIPVDHGSYGGMIQVDFSGISGLYSPSQVSIQSQDGAPSSPLRSVSVKSDGTIVGTYRSGLDRILGRIAVASFRNPGALTTDRRGLLIANRRSGTATVGIAGENGRASLVSGFLETP